MTTTADDTLMLPACHRSLMFFLGEILDCEWNDHPWILSFNLLSEGPKPFWRLSVSTKFETMNLHSRPVLIRLQIDNPVIVFPNRFLSENIDRLLVT